MQNKSIIYNNASSTEKVNPLLSSHIKISQYICLELFFSCNQCILYFSADSDKMTFSLEKAILKGSSDAKFTLQVV